MIARLKKVPPLVWVGAALVLGLGFVCWHGYARDETDTDWTAAKETPVPTMAPFPLVPGQHGAGQPMACGPAFRQRGYPGSLALADFSVVVGGDCR